ncbi:MAG: DUF721 domain-containing protein [bacterium]|nr:DUF721 domain-containing protein [bacterium]
MIESIGSIIRQFISRLQIEPQMKEGRILSDFARIIDPDLAEEVLPDRVEGEILFLQVKSSAGMNELKLRQKSLIRKINDHLGEKCITEIRMNLSNPQKK